MEVLYVVVVLVLGAVSLGGMAHHGYTPSRILSMSQDVVNNTLVKLSWRKLTIAGSIIAFLVSTLLMWYSFYKTLETSRDIARVNLARDLSKEFSSNDEFSKIYKSIVDCEVLYIKNGGSYDYDVINDYLGFFDTVAFFYHSGALDYNTVNHHFGGYIIEAFVYKEIQDYMMSLRQIAGEEGALEDFEKLSEEIKRDPKRQEQVKLYTRDCIQNKQEEPKK